MFVISPIYNTTNIPGHYDLPYKVFKPTKLEEKSLSL